MKGRLQFLKDNVGKPNKWLADKMGVDEIFVECMREHNNLTKQEVFGLDEDEKELMRELYPTATWIEIFEAFPHLSKSMIKERAYDLGLRREVRSNQ